MQKFMPDLTSFYKGFVSYVLLLALSVICMNAHAVTYQFRATYVLMNSTNSNSVISNYGDLYADVSGYTPSAYQAALTTNLGQTSLSGFACKTSQGANVAYNVQLGIGDYCAFLFPNESTSYSRRVTIQAIASGTMSGNVLTGTTGGGTSELPFDGLKASAIFAFFFSFVMGTWFITKNIGAILEAVKRW